MIERKRFRCILCFAALSLALLLPGCGAQDSDTPPQEPTALSAPLGSDGGFTLSLEAGRTTAALSGTLEDGTILAGQEVQLSHAPFLRDGALYLPLEEVVPLLGGSFVLGRDTATVTLAGHVAVYQAGQGTMTLDGQVCDLDSYSFGPSENPETAPPPILEDAGDVCGVRTTDPAQATPRGLKVGDSLDRANFLYGPFEEVQEGLYWLRNGVGLTGHCSLYLEAEGDRITAISLYTRFWGPAQMVEPGQEPDGAQASSGHPQ